MIDQSPLIALTGKQKKPNPYQNKAYCENLLNDIDALLNGGGKEVNHPEDYKNEKGDSLLPKGKSVIKSSIESRVSDLKFDEHNLAENHRTKDKAHPEYGSYEGHQHFLKNQQQALQMAITKFETQCKDKGYKLTQKDEELLNEAKKKAKEPIPQNPDRNPLQNSATRKVKDAPLIGSKFGSRTIDKIQRVVDKGWDYFNSEEGRKQMLGILDWLPPVVALKLIIEIGKYVFPVLIPQDRVQDSTREEPIIATTDKNPTSLTSNTTGTALQFTNNLTTTPAKVNEAGNIARNPTTTLIFDTLKSLNGETPPANTAAKVADNPINPTTASIDQTNQILASLLASNNPPVANNTPQQTANAASTGLQMSR